MEFKEQFEGSNGIIQNITKKSFVYVLDLLE